jgi:hypothetical protein
MIVACVAGLPRASRPTHKAVWLLPAHSQQIQQAQPTTTRSSGSKLVKRPGRLRDRLARLRLA